MNHKYLLINKLFITAAVIVSGVLPATLKLFLNLYLFTYFTYNLKKNSIYLKFKIKNELLSRVLMSFSDVKFNRGGKIGL